MTSAPPSEEDLDWENRRLCSDGNCIGVIGPDGRCKECGKAADEDQSGDAFSHQSSAPDPDTMDAGQEKEALASSPENEKEGPEDIEALPEDEPEDDWEKRRLCSDGNCIGVIGHDGRCKECGKPAGEREND